MTDSQDPSAVSSGSNSWKRAGRKINLRPFVTGIFPLFVIAHFGHHIVGAMLRPLTPMIRTDLNLSYTQVGWMNMAFGLTTGLSQLPGGRLADSVGVRIMVLLGVTGVAVAGFLVGLSNSFSMAVSFFILAALMGAGYHPASAAAISSSVPEEYRGRTLGVHLIGGTASFSLVPLIAAPIAVTWGWRSSFLILTVPIAILGVVLYALIGKLTLAKTIKRQEKKTGDESLTEPSKIRWGLMVPFIIMSVFTGAMFQSVQAYLALYATDVLRISESTAAMLMSISPSMGLFFAPLGGYLSDRFGSMRVLLIVCYIITPIIYLLGIAPTVVVLVILMIFAGFVQMTRMPASESYLTANTPQHRRATVLGIYYFSGTGISAPLAPIIGNLIDRIGFQRAFGSTSAVTAIIVVICSFLMWKNRKYDKYPEITGI